MNKKEIIGILKTHGLSPSKKHGQNFICNETIINRIIDAVDLNKKDRVLEIGPGLGALTNGLSRTGAKIVAVEIDKGFVAYLEKVLENKKNIEILHGDFLKTQLGNDFTSVVANLPYSCSSEILMKLATRYSVEKIFVMLQKEMAERIVSGPGKKSYGALTLSLGFYYKPELLFNIPKSSFFPQPEITSTFIALHKMERPDITPMEIEIYHKLVRAAFWGRRKKLTTSLSKSPHLKLGKAEIIKYLVASGIREGVRGEELTLDEFVGLTKLIFKSGLTCPEI